MTEIAAPIVSVVVPAYNAAAYITGTLASVCAQTLSAFELLVIDDASTDATVSLVEEAAARDSRIRLLRQPRNAGPSSARNRGIAEARGTWVALLDADDIFTLDRLERLVMRAERTDADMYADNLLLVPEGAPETAYPMIPTALLAADRPLGLAEFVRRNVADPAYPGLNLGFLKPIMRRSFLTEHEIAYDERVRFAEDYAFYIDSFRAGARWWLSPAPTYEYLLRANSLTQVQTVHDLNILRRRIALMVAEARESGDREMEALMRRHRRVVDRLHDYRLFTDRLKSGQIAVAFGALFGSARTATLVFEESMRQLPLILRKASRGGYR